MPETEALWDTVADELTEEEMDAIIRAEENLRDYDQEW